MKNSAHDKNRLAAEHLIEIWALRTAGGTLKDPCKVSTGGEPSSDRDLVKVRYVESTPGFAVALPVLLRFRAGEPIEGLWWVPKNWTAFRAALGLGWNKYFFMAKADRRTPVLVIHAFARSVALRLESDPPVYAESAPNEIISDDPGEIAAAASDWAERKFPNRWIIR